MRAFLQASWDVLPWLLVALIAFNFIYCGVALIAGGVAAAIPFLVGLIAAAVMLALWVLLECCR